MMPLRTITICNHDHSPAKQVHFSHFVSKQQGGGTMLPFMGANPYKYIGSSCLRRIIRGQVQGLFEDFHFWPRCMLPSE